MKHLFFYSQYMSQTVIEEEDSTKFECKICEYYTFKINDYNRHLLTNKHIVKKFATDCNCENNKEKVIKIYLSKEVTTHSKNNEKFIWISL